MSEHIFDMDMPNAFDAHQTPETPEDARHEANTEQPTSRNDQQMSNAKSALPSEIIDAADNTDLDEMTKLAQEGFTPDEVARLLSMSERVAHSSEAQESEAVLRRLRFTRWLVEQGLLSEFPG